MAQSIEGWDGIAGMTALETLILASAVALLALTMLIYAVAKLLPNAYQRVFGADEANPFIDNIVKASDLQGENAQALRNALSQTDGSPQALADAAAKDVLVVVVSDDAVTIPTGMQASAREAYSVQGAHGEQIVNLVQCWEAFEAGTSGKKSMILNGEGEVFVPNKDYKSHYGIEKNNKKTAAERFVYSQILDMAVEIANPDSCVKSTVGTFSKSLSGDEPYLVKSEIHESSLGTKLPDHLNL